MVTVGVSGPYSFVKNSVFTPGQLLLADHCCHDLPEIRQTLDTNAYSESVVPENANAGQQIDTPELINASVPRVSCCLLDASLALGDKRIEDLCAHLMQASIILHDLLVAVRPNAEALGPDFEPLTLDTKTELALTPITDGGEGAPLVEIARAMASAA